MNEKEIAKQYEENRVKVLPLLEELVEQFKKDKSSLDIQQLRLITEYLIWDREFDENYIDEMQKEENRDILLTAYEKEKEKNKNLQQIIIINEKLYSKETKRLGNIIDELLEE